MSVRDESLLAIRPEIIAEIAEQDALKQFQDVTLRKILKLQNDTLITLCRSHLKKNYKNFDKQQPTDRIKNLQQVLKNDTSLKILLYGIIAGHFTAPELDFYLANSNEVNKRLTAFILKRVSEQI